MSDFFKKYMSDIYNISSNIDRAKLLRCSQMISDTNDAGGQVLIFGNGGSAAMASHISVDLVKAARVRASNFNEADLITCFSNDFGYENWVKKSIEFYSQPNDLVLLISSSGSSANILNGALMARKLKLPVITLSGFDESNPLKAMGDVNLYAASSSYNYVEMAHHIWLVAIVDHIINEKAK